MVAAEVHFLSDAVEPAVSQPVRSNSQRPLASLRRRLRNGRLGRAALSCSRWALVAGLVLSGYFAAAGINAVLQLLRSGTSTQHMIATSAHGD